MLKAGDEIKSLARFTSTQRTAFRKLLKKYKKWTGSTQVDERFHRDALNDSKSFTKLDLGPLLDEYSVTLQHIRTLYEERIWQETPGAKRAPKPVAGGAAVTRLQDAAHSGSKAEFDTAIAAVPLGDSGTFASFFVHKENVVELQVLLLQHAHYCMSRSRSNSLNEPISPVSSRQAYENAAADTADYFAAEADDPIRFAQEQNTLTINDHEHKSGSMPQRAQLCARWTLDEVAILARRSSPGKEQLARLKRKHATAFFNKSQMFPSKKAALTDDDEKTLMTSREAYEKDVSSKHLYSYSSSRSRFIGIDGSPARTTLATLDTDITIQGADTHSTERHIFPFAVLLVRQEGLGNGGLLAAVDQTHLVERVPGFSMEYHAIWQTSQSPSIPAPFWLPILDRDIRKLPSPAVHRNASTSGTPNSNGSVNGATDSTTAVESLRSTSAAPPKDLDNPPARSFRKKRRRGHAEQQQPQQHQQQRSQGRYWSEYDHPEDGSDAGGDPYVIYIDPNEKSSLERLFDRIGALLSRRKRREGEEEGLLTSDPASPTQDESSDDETDTNTPTSRRAPKSYGTPSSRQHHSGPRGLTGPADPSPFVNTRPKPQHKGPLAPQLTPVCFAASLSILLMAYILATTGRKKERYEVDFGVLFAIASSLFFSVVGFAGLLRFQEVSWPAWSVGMAVLVLDVVGSGGLLAWMLG